MLKNEEKRFPHSQSDIASIVLVLVNSPIAMMNILEENPKTYALGL